MKTKIIDKNGKAEKEISLPEIFSSKIREDIVQKYYEASKVWHPHSPYEFAGMEYSAAGKLSHRRNAWKTTYGHGISRVPRKIFWRRGTQFYWQGATVSGTRGGRRAHHPQVEHFTKVLKTNKKEVLLAMTSALSATMNAKYIKRRYESIQEKEIKLPFIIDSEILKLNTKQFFEFLQKVFNDLIKIAIQNKKVRAGKGKSRGRKYKKSAGLLLVIGNNEKFKINGIDVRKVSELSMRDLYPLGRLTMYSENSIKELENLFGEKK